MSAIRSLWSDLWPNMVAPSVWTLAAILVSHLRTRMHIRTSHQATLTAVAGQLDEHHKKIRELLAAHCADIKEHTSAAVADAQVSAGPGTNPGQSGGLPADERVVPPAATTGRRHRP